MKEFKKEDFENGDIVILRNGDKLRYVGYCKEFVDIYEDKYDISDNALCDLDDLEDDLTYKGNSRKNDIIKVERPSYTTIYEREEVAKEMTIAEIEKALGYKVKIKE